ncbi:MAG: SUMF1/EgtB/PvdO family nonheme iron enzyme [Bacteroidales bacterium]|nr:SUMF1/EgtB/PvdO family nonheme iron enzyme [Bacteroidales bacterium]
MALVIGNGDYRHGASLRNPVNDAGLMAATLQELGFEVILQKDAGRIQIAQAVADFWSRLSEYDVALFYYAGHGVQIDGINYLIPVDAELKDKNMVAFEAISVNDIVSKFDYYTDNTNIIILDACRHNPFRAWTRGNERGFVAMKPASGTLIAFATSEGETADDGAGNHGLYTEKLVQQMKMPQSVESVFKNTRREVESASNYRQSPQEWTKLVGDFYFLPSQDMSPGEPLPPEIGTPESILEYGSIQLTTELTGQLYLDGNPLTPITANTRVPVNKVTAGPHTLELRGEENWSRHIHIAKDQTLELTIEKKALPPTDNKPAGVDYGIEMVFVQGGTFTMGCTGEQGSDCEDDEKPAHQVTLSDYYIGKYEVTVGQFKQFIDATGYRTDAEKGGGSYLWNGKKWEIKESVTWRCNAEGNTRPVSENGHPVIHVSWNDATEYCKWLSRQTGKNYRLPTEAEWEYAARSRGKAYKYSWGNGGPSGNIADESAKKVFSDWSVWKGYDDGYVYTAPVGKFNANDLGLHDMSGNVWEWCSDWYGALYYSASPVSNPWGPSDGTHRVVRGGSWGDGPRGCRVSSRSRGTPDLRYDGNGFRLAMDSE